MYNEYAIKNGFFVVQGYSYLIVLFAMIVRNVHSALASKNRFKQKTSELVHATMSIFAVYLVIYGFVPLFATYDLRTSTAFSFFEEIFRGMYYDFNAEWFQDVGLLVSKTMTANIFMPPVHFVLGWLRRYLNRACDQYSKNWCCSLKGDLKNS